MQLNQHVPSQTHQIMLSNQHNTPDISHYQTNMPQNISEQTSQFDQSTITIDYSHNEMYAFNQVYITDEIM